MSSHAKKLLAVVCVGLLVRVVAATVLGHRFHFADEAEYLDAARRLLSGLGFDAGYERVPGYPALLALLAAPAAGSVLWVRLAQAVVATTGIVLTGLLANRVAGPTAAIAAALIYALDPLVTISAGLLYPEAAAALLLAAAVLALEDAARRDSLARSAAAGALLGVLILFRPVALVTMPVAAAWVAFAATAAPLRRAGHALAVALVCVAMLVPWTYRNYQLHGGIVPIAVAGTGGTGMTKQDLARSGVAVALLEQARNDPGRLATRMGREFVHFWELVPERLKTDDPAARAEMQRLEPRLETEPLGDKSLRNLVAGLSSGIELLLAVAGLAVLWRSGRREAVLLGGLILAYALGHSLFVGKMRYRITILPLVFVLAGAAIAALHRNLRSTRPGLPPGPASAGAGAPPRV